MQLLSVHHNFRDQLREGPLKAVPDLDAAISKMRKQNAGLEEIFRLYLFVRSLPALLSILTQLQQQLSCPSEPALGPADAAQASPAQLLRTLSAVYVEPLQGTVQKFSLFEQLVESLLDFSFLPGFRINSVYSPALAELYACSHELQQKVEAVHRQWAREYGELRLEKNAVYGYVLRNPNTNIEKELKQHRQLRTLAIQKTGIFIRS